MRPAQLLYDGRGLGFDLLESEPALSLDSHRCLLDLRCYLKVHPVKVLVAPGLPAKFSSFFLGFWVLVGTGRSSVAKTRSVTARSVTSTGILRIAEKMVAFSLSRYRDVVVKAD